MAITVGGRARACHSTVRASTPTSLQVHVLDSREPWSRPGCGGGGPAENNMGVSENVGKTPKPNGFADHYPVFKWLFHWEYTLFSNTPTCVFMDFNGIIFASACYGIQIAKLVYPITMVYGRYKELVGSNWTNKHLTCYNVSGIHLMGCSIEQRLIFFFYQTSIGVTVLLCPNFLCWSESNSYPLVNIQKAIENGPVEIVDFPINSMVDLSSSLAIYSGFSH